MRLFAAIQPSPGFRAALEDLQGRLREAGVTGKYREPDGLHMTLAFIGEWPENVTGILPAVQKPISITLSRLGIFPSWRSRCGTAWRTRGFPLTGRISIRILRWRGNPSCRKT